MNEIYSIQPNSFSLGSNFALLRDHHQGYERKSEEFKLSTEHELGFIENLHYRVASSIIAIAIHHSDSFMCLTEVIMNITNKEGFRIFQYNEPRSRKSSEFKVGLFQHTAE